MALSDIIAARRAKAKEESKPPKTTTPTKPAKTTTTTTPRKRRSNSELRGLKKQIEEIQQRLDNLEHEEAFPFEILDNLLASIAFYKTWDSKPRIKGMIATLCERRNIPMKK
jgi:hypothetical protein